MSKIASIVSNQTERFVLLATVATALFAEKFYAGRTQEWGNATSEQAKNAEAQFNDPASGVYGDTRFAATIKALTGEDIKMRAAQTVDFRVGVVIVPVAPAYGERTNDGYEVGKAYLCTNESSGGRFRNADNVAAKMTNGKSNQVGIMSHASDEVRPATEEEIETLAGQLLAVKGLSLLQDILPDLESRYAHLVK